MINVGPAVFHVYGLMIALGVLLGAFVSSRWVGKVKLSEEEWWDVLLWVVAGGVVGARIYHVIDLWSYYSLDLWEILKIWKGGLGIYGGIVGGVLGLWLRVRSKKELVKWLDVAAMGLPWGQAVGRWGNFFNQELYGKPTDLPWGISIDLQNRLASVWQWEKFHPLFLYESLWNVAVGLGLWWLVKKGKVKMGKGKGFITYLGLYGLGRFALEFLRIDPWRVSGVNVAQAISLILVGLSAISFWLDRK